MYICYICYLTLIKVKALNSSLYRALSVHISIVKMGILSKGDRENWCAFGASLELQFLADMHWLHFSDLEVAARGWISLYASDSTSYLYCAASLHYGWWWIWKKVRSKWSVCQLASAFASNNQSPPLSCAQGMSFSLQITKVKRPPWHSTALHPSLHTTRIHHVLGFVLLSELAPLPRRRTILALQSFGLTGGSVFITNMLCVEKCFSQISKNVLHRKSDVCAQSGF